MKRKNIKPSAGYWMIYLLPALFIYIVFMAYPLIDSLRLSFYSGNPTGEKSFVGLEKFIKLFADPDYSVRYWGAFKNTWIFFLIHMLVQNCLGITFAVLLTNETLKYRNLYRTIIFIPATLAILVTGYLWKLILNPIWSQALLSPIGFDFLSRPWLGQECTALICVSLVSSWQWVGIPTMMFSAALQNIPGDIIEASYVEGANNRIIFWKIKLPLILPVIGIIAILTFVNNFNAFDVVYAMETANGAPGYSTDIIGTLFYRTGIAGQHPIGIPDTGMGAAITTITFIILCLGVLPVLRLTQTKAE